MLDVVSLSVFYGGIHALKEISLTVPQGEIVTLIGANGAGKSTALRTIRWMVEARQGEFASGEEKFRIGLPSNRPGRDRHGTRRKANLRHLSVEREPAYGAFAARGG